MAQGGTCMRMERMRMYHSNDGAFFFMWYDDATFFSNLAMSLGSSRDNSACRRQQHLVSQHAEVKPTSHSSRVLSWIPNDLILLTFIVIVTLLSLMPFQKILPSTISDCNSAFSSSSPAKPAFSNSPAESLPFCSSGLPFVRFASNS